MHDRLVSQRIDDLHLCFLVYNYSPPIFIIIIIQSHTFAAENCAIGDIVK